MYYHHSRGMIVPLISKYLKLLILTAVGIFAAFQLAVLAKSVSAAPADVADQAQFQAALLDNSVETINIVASFSVNTQMTVARNVTINGNGHTITQTAPRVDGANDATIGINADNITINNLVVDGSPALNRHGIDIYAVSGITLNNITSQNNGRSGIGVNGSEVTVHNVTTSGNVWHGINPDSASGPAVLTITGVSSHSDWAHIQVDSDAEDVTINDVNNQYQFFVNTANQYVPAVSTTRYWHQLRPKAPVHLFPANGQAINYNDFWFDWADVSGADSYETQYSQNPAVGIDGAFTNVQWTGDYQNIQPTDSEARSVGANGIWYWQVRTVDSLPVFGVIYSGWTNPWSVHIDLNIPAAPTITFPNPEQNFTSTPISNQWTAVSDASGIAKYQVAYRYDDGHTFGGSTCPGETIEGNWVGCRDVTSGTSRNHNPGPSEQGGVTIWVRAIDGAGNVGPWSTPRHYYYDSTNPDAFLVSPANNSVVSGSSLTQVWGSNAADVKHYLYESWHDEAMTSLRWSETIADTSKTATNVTDATFWWRVRAVDHAGNMSPWTPLWKIIVDNSPNGIIKPSFENEGFGFTGTVELEAQDTGAALGAVQWAVRMGTCNANAGVSTVWGNVDGRNDPYSWVNGTFTSSVGGLPIGTYCFVFNPTQGERLTRWFQVVNPLADTDIDGDNQSDNSQNQNRINPGDEPEEELEEAKVLADTDGLAGTGSIVAPFGLASAFILAGALWVIRRQKQNS